LFDDGFSHMVAVSARCSSLVLDQRSRLVKPGEFANIVPPILYRREGGSQYAPGRKPRDTFRDVIGRCQRLAVLVRVLWLLMRIPSIVSRVQLCERQRVLLLLLMDRKNTPCGEDPQICSTTAEHL